MISDMPFKMRLRDKVLAITCNNLKSGSMTLSSANLTHIAEIGITIKLNACMHN